MDAIALLTADHNRVRGLFAKFNEAQDSEDMVTMAAVAAKISTELQIHTTIEEEIFYPWCRQLADDIPEIVDEGLQEHHQVKVLLTEASDLEPGDDTWVAKFTVIIEDVEHHAQEEESEMFPKVRSHSDAQERDELGARLDARKGELGAPVLAATIDLTVEELRDLAKDQSIPGRSTMDHDELAATVNPS
jgi:hemerythrin superfamily protein